MRKSPLLHSRKQYLEWIVTNASYSEYDIDERNKHKEKCPNEYPVMVVTTTHYDQRYGRDYLDEEFIYLHEFLESKRDLVAALHVIQPWRDYNDNTTPYLVEVYSRRDAAKVHTTSAYYALEAALADAAKWIDDNRYAME